LLGFYINLPAGGLVTILLLFVDIPTRNIVSRPPGLLGVQKLMTDMDVVGFVIFAPAAIQLLLALQYGGNQFAWNSATVIGLFCGAAGTFFFFLVWEFSKGDSAMIPFSMMRQKVVWSSCLLFGFLMGGLYTATYYLPIYFQAVKGASPTTSGAWLLPSILGQLFAAVVAGALGKLLLHLRFTR
jgi:hypothetical protein